MSMQTRLYGAREVLSYAATKDRYSYRALGSMLESARIPMYRQNVIEHLRPLLAKRVFLGLGRVLYSQRRNEMDFLDALTIYELTEEIYGPEAIQGGPDRSIYGDLLIWRGRHDKALTVLAPGPRRRLDLLPAAAAAQRAEPQPDRGRQAPPRMAREPQRPARPARSGPAALPRSGEPLLLRHQLRSPRCAHPGRAEDQRDHADL